MAGLQGAGGEGQDDSADGLRPLLRLGHHLLSLAAGLLVCCAAPAAGEVELLLEAVPGLKAPALGPDSGDGVHVRAFGVLDLGDPISSGRLSARIQGSEGAVLVGFQAADWGVRELEGVRVHFVGGASRIPAALLKTRGWSAELAFPAEPFIQLARSEGWRRVGILHAEGYDEALRSIRAAASAQGVSLEVRAVAGRKAIPAAAMALVQSCSALWVLGDPMLSAGAGFDYLVELSLARKVPLLAPEPAMVEAGAYAAWEPDMKEAAGRAAGVARAAAAHGWPPAGISIGAGGGRLRINQVLRRRWSRGEPR